LPTPAIACSPPPSPRHSVHEPVQRKRPKGASVPEPAWGRCRRSGPSSSSHQDAPPQAGSWNWTGAPAFRRLRRMPIARIDTTRMRSSSAKTRKMEATRRSSPASETSIGQRDLFADLTTRSLAPGAGSPAGRRRRARSSAPIYRERSRLGGPQLRSGRFAREMAYLPTLRIPAQPSWPRRSAADHVAHGLVVAAEGSLLHTRGLALPEPHRDPPTRDLIILAQLASGRAGHAHLLHTLTFFTLVSGTNPTPLFNATPHYVRSANDGPGPPAPSAAGFEQ
jgi:hypothetical protein